MINEDIAKFLKCQNIADDLQIDLVVTGDGSLVASGEFVVRVEKGSYGVEKTPKTIQLAHYSMVSEMYAYLLGFRRAVKLYRDFRGD